MKEHTDAVLSSATSTVDSTSGDEIVTERGKTEDMTVDVVSADVEDSAAVVKEASDDVVEVVVNEEGVKESVEVVKEVIQENVSTDVERKSDCDDKDGPLGEDSKTASEAPSKEQGGIQVGESVQVVPDSDHVMEEETRKEAVVLDSSKIPESNEGCVVAVEEGVVSKDKDEDGVTVNDPSSLAEVVDGGTGEDDANVSAKNTENQDGSDQANKERSQSEVEDSKMAVDLTSADPQVSIKEEGSVMNEETIKVEALDSTKNAELLSGVDEVVVEECLAGKDESAVHENAKNVDQKAEVDQMSKEDSLQSTIQVYDASKSEDSKMDDEPQIVEGEIAVKDKKEDPERGLAKETVEQPTDSVQKVPKKDDVLNSSKISQTMASIGLEDVDVVVVDEGLEGKNEAHDSVSVELSLVCPGNKRLSTDIVSAGAREVDQKVEANSTSKDEISYATIATDEVAHKEPYSQVKVFTDVTDSSKHDVVANTELEPEPEPEPESSIDKMTPGITNKAVETDIGVQTSKVEPATIGGNSSNIEEDQGLIANPSNEGNEVTVSHIGVPDSMVGVPSTGELHTHGVLPANLEGEDAGMDIDEVLGWKDETLSVHEQKVDDTKKRKAVDSISEAKPSLKVGAVIQQVASQPSRPPLKGEPADHVAATTASVQSPGPTQMENKAEMLSQLNLAAQDPMKGHSFMNTIIPFFKSHRAAVLSKSRLSSSGEGRKRKTSNENESDEFEFDDVNDSYWTDRIIQNHPEEQGLQENPNGGAEHQIVAYEQEKPLVKPTRRSNKKRFFSSNHEIEAKEQSEVIMRRQQNLATEVLMKFAEGAYFPSEIHLNKMFRRFGPLMESETEVDRQSGRARVVFKKCSDAEVAHSSAGKFNIFGSISVNYELNYTPVISYKPLPLPLAQDPPHAC